MAEITVQQIVVEQIREADGSTVWEWNAFGEQERECGGSAASLLICLESMLAYLKAEGIAASAGARQRPVTETH